MLAFFKACILVFMDDLPNKSMSSLNSPSPVGDATSVASLSSSLSLGHSGEVLKAGYLKKLKTMKKKYFVLRCESADYPARLEYYDSEKKYKAHQPPKRSISLKACFNINRRLDLKQKNVIALYTKDDCFCIVLDSEEDRESWLKALWTLQDGGDVTDGETPKPLFEHVWKVEVAKKGLGASRNINGQYHLCLTGKTVSLVRILSDGSKDTLEFPLQNIRSFGSAQSFFYMEVGRNAVTGTGAIWMEVEDAVIAKDMNRHIDAMRSKSDDSGSKQIGRSASVSESSRPISMTSRRHNSASGKQEDSGSSAPNANETSSGYISNLDSYCEMMQGPARYGTTDHDGSALSRTGSVPYNFLYCQLSQRCAQQQQQQPCRVNNNILSHPNRRRHSVSAVSVSTPGAAGCWASGCKGGPPLGSGTTGATPPLVHHHQRTYSFPLSPLPPSTSVRRGSIGGKAGQRASAHCSSAGRDRSDSLPSSVRASTENHSFSHGPMAPHSHYAHHTHGRNLHFIPSGHRPHSMHSRGISHSPPVGSSPVSPASAACSTDSAGSSLSIDEGDNWVDSSDVHLSLSSRFALNHPLTPESLIEEENCDDHVQWPGPSALDSGVGDDEKMNNYMPMDRLSATLSLPIQQPHSGASRKFSPGRGNVVGNVKSGSSPSHSNYMEMNSPCGSSPLETPENYMTMSPGTAPDCVRNAAFYSRGIQQMHTAPNSANHSRTSSLAEETPDGYTPMMPGQTDDGYVDMDPRTADGHEDYHGEMSPSSSCSITSGTPSTDLRFSEYPLEKVNSYLTPSEEEETGERPTRCYSVGSKPDSLNKKNRVDFINQTDCSRVRAFSVGSRNGPGSKYTSRPLGHDIHATRHTFQAGHFSTTSQQKQLQPGGSKKSSSAPILSHHLSSSPMNRHILSGSHSSVEPMDDLMEMDFSPSVSNATKSSRNKSMGKTVGRSKSSCVNDSLSMSPADRDRLTVPGGPSHHSSQSSVASSYSTAEGLDSSVHVGSPRGIDCIGMGSPPKTPMLRSMYSNSTSVGRSPPENVARSPPNRSTASPRSAVTRMSCISELKPQNFPTTTPSPPIKPCLHATNNSAASMAAKMAKMAVSSPYVEMSPSNLTSKPVIATSSASKPSTDYVEMKGPKPVNQSTPVISEDYLDMSFKPRRTSVPDSKDLPNPSGSDGYVEMGWRSTANSDSHSKSLKTSLDSQKSNANEDYMNMSGGSLSSTRNHQERRGSLKKERNQLRSQPINIQQPTQNRKIVMDTPPKAPPGFLPLANSLDSQSPLSSPSSSLRRNRSRKSSKDSCSGNSGLTTPSGSNSTIFPISLNSPGSPLKPFAEDSSPSLPSVPSGASFDKLEKVPADMSSGTLRLSYPQAGVSSPRTAPGASKQENLKHDYVNFDPNSTESTEKSSRGKIEDDSGDYAVMCPGASSTFSSMNDHPKKNFPSPGSFSKSIPSKLSSDGDLGRNQVSLPSEVTRPSSKPLTVSSLLGMNNLSPTSSPTESLNNLNSTISASATTPKLVSKLAPSKSIMEKKLQNCDSISPVICPISESEAPSALATSFEVEESILRCDVSASTIQAVGSGAPVILASPSLSPSPSPNPSPCSEGSVSHTNPSSPANAAGASPREKKMSSGSDSSTASRDSQLLVRKHSAGSVSPSGNGGKSKSCGASVNTISNTVSRRLSCPSKSSVSRQVSLSSDLSDASQIEDSRLSESGASLSRQTSSSSASGETSSPALVLTDKRSLSCSPVPSSASPVPRPAEREINYASLDLRTGSESEDSSSRSPRGLKTQGSLSESQSSTSSPSPNPPGGTFTYAQIDFEKSEELRKSSAAKSVKQ